MTEGQVVFTLWGTQGPPFGWVKWQLTVCAACHKWISDDQSSFMFGSLVHIHTNCMACAFCGAHPKWWVGKEIGLLICEKCYEERDIATLPRSKLEELVRSLEAQKAEAEETKKIAKREYPATTQFRGAPSTRDWELQ